MIFPNVLAYLDGVSERRQLGEQWLRCGCCSTGEADSNDDGYSCESEDDASDFLAHEVSSGVFVDEQIFLSPGYYRTLSGLHTKVMETTSNQMLAPQRVDRPSS